MSSLDSSAPRRLSVFDVDGVLANDEHRVQYAVRKEWGVYFEPDRMLLDTVWPQGRVLVFERIEAGDDVIYMTGRRQDRRAVTEAWMHWARLPRRFMWCRPMDEKRRLAEIKAEAMEFFARQYDEVVIYDDDPEVIRLVRERLGESAGVHCTWSVKSVEMIKLANA